MNIEATIHEFKKAQLEAAIAESQRVASQATYRALHLSGDFKAADEERTRQHVITDRLLDAMARQASLERQLALHR